MAMDFFELLYTEEGSTSIEFGLPNKFPNWQMIDGRVLTMQVKVTDIRRALFSMGALKATGPVRYQSRFFLENWKLVAKEVICFDKGVFNKTIPIRDVNQIFLRLWPKC